MVTPRVVISYVLQDRLAIALYLNLKFPYVPANDLVLILFNLQTLNNGQNNKKSIKIDLNLNRLKRY